MDESMKGEGQGRGAYTRKGVQRSQAEAIAALQSTDEGVASVLAEMDSRITALETAEAPGDEPTA